LAELLGAMDEGSSTLKDTALSMVGTLAAMGHATAVDEIIKNSLANFAFENYEIAAYNSLLILAELGMFNRAADLLQANLNEEQAMADWLRENLRQTTLRFVQLSNVDEDAKV